MNLRNWEEGPACQGRIFCNCGGSQKRRGGEKEKRSEEAGKAVVSLLVDNPLVPLQEAVRLRITTVTQPNTTLLTEPLAVAPLLH